MGLDWESARWRVDLFFSLFDSVLNPDYVYVTKLVGTVKRKIEPSVKEIVLSIVRVLSLEVARLPHPSITLNQQKYLTEN
jgi:hypothetical protein